MEKEIKKNRVYSDCGSKDLQETLCNKENFQQEYNVLQEEPLYKNRYQNNIQLNNHHLLNQNYKHTSSRKMQLASLQGPLQFTGNQLQDLYDKLKEDYTKLMIDYQKEQMECNNIKSQSKLDQKKVQLNSSQYIIQYLLLKQLNELDKIVIEQLQEIVTLNNEIKLQTSQNHVLKQYLKEQDFRGTKINADSVNITQDISTICPNSLKKKSISSIVQQNDLKSGIILQDNKEQLERQIDMLQQQNAKLLNQNSELQQQINQIKIQFCTLESHSQKLQRNAIQLELQSNQNKITENLLSKNFQKLEEDYIDKNKEYENIKEQLENEINVMKEYNNHTLFWEQTAKQLEHKQHKMEEDKVKKKQNLREMNTYIQTIKGQFRDERERLINEQKSYKKEIQLYKEKSESLNQNLSAIQKDYISLKNQSKIQQEQTDLIKNLNETLVSIESSLTREIRINEEKSTFIKQLEQQVDELKGLNNSNQSKIVKLEEQIVDLALRQKPTLDTLNLSKDQQFTCFANTNFTETPLNYSSCNSNANTKRLLQTESQWDLQEKVRRLEQTIFELKNQINQQNGISLNDSNQIQFSYALPHYLPKNISIPNSPINKNYITQQFTPNSHSNIHSYQNCSLNQSRPFIDIDRSHSYNNSSRFRKGSYDAQAYQGSSCSGLYLNKNKLSPMENLHRKYQEIKNRVDKNR